MPRALRDRLRALPEGRIALAVTVLVALELQVEAWLVAPGSVATRTLLSGACLLITAGVAVRHRSPLLGVVLAMAMGPPVAALPDETVEAVVGPVFAGLVPLFALGRHEPRGRVVALGAVVASGLLVATLLGDPFPDDAGGFLVGVGFGVLGPLALGRALRDRAHLREELEARAAELEADRAAGARRAVDAERERIAGELHDVVSHALGSMVVQAGGARRAIGRDDAAAATAFGAVETTGRDALDEIRRLLGVLRREDEDLALAPQPGLAHVGALARRVTAAGLPVGVSVEGEARDLPPGLDLTAYRVVQEALAGAREAGGAGRAAVVVRWGPERLDLEVADDGASPAPRPLLGIRERLALLGGELAIERGPDGGQVLRARLPVGGAA